MLIFNKPTVQHNKVLKCNDRFFYELKNEDELVSAGERYGLNSGFYKGEKQ